MQRAAMDGITLGYEVQGAGEPVIFIHGALFESFGPMSEVPPLKDRFRLIRYNRRGYAGSTGDGAVPIAKQAADCAELLSALGAKPAHIVGHSGGAIIALQLTLDSPDAVRSLTLLEPPLPAVPSRDQLFEKIGQTAQMFEAGDSAEAFDTFMKGVCGERYRAAMEKALPGTIEQAITDAATFFGGEFQAAGEWAFGPEDAARIKQPVLAVVGAESGAVWHGWDEGHKLLLQWFPNAKPFVLPQAAHLLQVENPHDMAKVWRPSLRAPDARNVHPRRP